MFGPFSLLVGSDGDPMVVAALLTIGGPWIAVESYRRYRQRRLIEDTPTSEVEAVSVGTAELAGTVEPAEATLPGMLSEGPHVAVGYEVKKRVGDDWYAEDSGQLSRPFYLNDGTDRILVDPAGADFDTAEERSAELEREEDPSEPLPDRLRGFLRAHTDADPDPDPDHEWRYGESVLPVGADAYVFGDAEIADEVDVRASPADDAAELVVTEDADTEMFLISDKSESALVAERKGSLVGGGLLGVAMFAAGLWWLLSLLGV